MKKIYCFLLLFVSFNLVAQNNVLELLDYSRLTDSKAYFIENKGQWDKDIKYVSKMNGLTLVINNNAMFFNYYKISPVENSNLQNVAGHVISTNFNNTENYSITGLKVIPTKFNYFKGSDQSKWVTGVSAYNQIKLNNVYKGIDAVLSFDNSRPRYDFIILPGADPSQISLSYTGAYSLELKNNDLVIKTSLGDVLHSKLTAYQENGENVNQVQCNFKLINNKINFELGNYNHNLPLIIDPTVFADYIGGSDEDQITSVKIFQDSTIVVAGWTKSMDFKTTPGAYDSILGGDKDIIVRKLTVTGTNRSMVFSTVIGGGGTDDASGVAIDPDGDIYLTGSTQSSDFPTMNPLYATYAGSTDAYITKLAKTGDKLIYSTFVGGGKEDVATAIAVNLNKTPVICGYTNSTNFPMAGAPYQNKLKGQYDAFIFRLNAAGKSIDLATYWGGAGNDKAWAIAMEDDGGLYFTGETNSGGIPDFPALPYRTVTVWGTTTVVDKPFQLANNGGYDAFVVKMDATGGPEYCTFFGGNTDDRGTAISFMPDGTVLFAGETVKEPSKPKFPTTSNAYSITNKGGIDGFLAKLDKVRADGQGNKSQLLLFSTFFGGSGDDNVTGMSFYSNSDGIYLTGKTTSSNFPTKGDGTTNKIAGKADAYILKMATLGNDIIWGSLLGGADVDCATSIDITSQGDPVIGGYTASTNLVKSNINFQGNNNGGVSDGFVLKYVLGSLTITNPVVKDKFCANSNVDVKYDYATPFSDTTKFEMRYRLSPSNNWVTVTKSAVNGDYKWLTPSIDMPLDSVQVMFTHPSGLNVTSPFFTLMSSPKISISSTIPADLNACEGDSFSIITNVVGTSPGFKWYFNNNLIPNQTTKDLSIKSVKSSDAGRYKLVVVGLCKPDATSQEIVLNIKPATVITDQPKDLLNFKKGLTAQFSVAATGLNLKYQWLRNNNKILSANDSTYKMDNVQSSQEGKYSCVVTGDCGIDTSSQATLTIDNSDVFENPDNSSANNIKIIRESKDEVVFSVNIPESLNSDIKLYNILGYTVQNIFSGNVEASNEYKINKTALSAGIYWITIDSGKNRFVKKVIITQ